MYKRWAIALFITSIITSGFNVSVVHGASGRVVIAQIQAGAASDEAQAPTKEFVSIYNNSDVDVEITGWCMTNKSNVSFACFVSPTARGKLILPSASYATISSDSFASANHYKPDVTYPTTNNVSGSIVASGDTLTLMDVAGMNVDQVSYATSLPGGSVLQRREDPSLAGRLMDTDTSTDFQKMSTLIVLPSGVTEQVVAVDACPNIDGLQDNIPDSYVVNDNSECVVDICQNLPGVQEVVPNGYGLGDNKQCVEQDICPNIPDIQTAIPSGYKLIDVSCVRDILPLKITELLPNPMGSDVGNEFVELYNPNDTAVDLALYTMKVGADSGKVYTFPTGSTIEPMSYKVFMNSEIAFTLVNTVSRVGLMGIDGSSIDESEPYNNPADGMAWALIDGTWQYTNQPTPGSENQASVVPIILSQQAATNLAVCAPNQYRNPDTNRCRLIATPASTQTPCKVGQYRNEETNRCRSIVADSGVLGACADNQERNPDTNRCRLIASASPSVTPCKEGQERNPDTNRCRNIVKMSQAGYPVEPVAASSSGSGLAWLVGGGIGLAVVMYGVWEWRREVVKVFRRLLAMTRSK